MSGRPGAAPAPPGAPRAADVLAGLLARLAVRGAHRRRPAAPVDRHLALTVVAVRTEADDVAGLTLAGAGAGPLPAWRPGAHLDLVLPSGLVRPYSLCGEPADRHAYHVAVRRLPGGTGSAEVHALRPGDRVGARGPRNAFPLVPAPAYLFLAGGIGITPLRPMARAAAAAGVPWRLVHAGRTLASLPLSADLDPHRVHRRADDEHGGPPTAADLLDGLAPGTAVYCCGPSPMIDAVRAALPADVPFHAERFAPPPVPAGRPFTLELVGSGMSVAVPADRSALDAVRAVLPAVPYSCRRGFCGTCHVRAAPGGAMMALCVDRPDGPRIAVDL